MTRAVSNLLLILTALASSKEKGEKKKWATPTLTIWGRIEDITQGHGSGGGLLR